MDLNEANRFKVYIIESLEGDMHTGQNLYDYLRQRNVDYTDYMFDAMYICNHPIFDVFCISQGLCTFAPAKYVELCLV